LEARLGKQFERPPTCKITRAKWTRVVAQAVECLLLQVQSPEFKSQFQEKKERERERDR
jgi:hypothetical protein